MKISIVGYGKMGREVESICRQSSIDIDKIIDIDSLKNVKNSYFYKDEVAIEFSCPNSVISNIENLAKKKVNIICGTTGWLKDKEYVEHLVKKYKIGFLYSANFSIGVNLFFRIVEKSSKLFNYFEDYDPIVREVHHKNKKDCPSGTALAIGNILLNNLDRKKNIVTNFNSNLSNSDINISSSRGGSIIGIHDVIYDSLTDVIKIQHISKDRISYAVGAIKCAKWIINKVGFFTMKNYLDDIYSNLK